MNTNKLTIIMFMAAALLSACDKQVERIEAEGAIKLGVDIPATKAAMSADELLSNASVKIYRADFTGLVRSYKYSEAPSTIYLPVDTYRVDVEAGEASKANPSVASWEQKSYAGSKEFTVTANQTGNVQVTATVSNVVTKVDFDATIAENFNDGYKFTIGLSTSDAAQQLVYNASKTGQEGYFIASGFEPSLYWSFTGTLKSDGSSFNKSGEIPAVEGGKLYTMKPKFTIKDGTAGFTLYVDRASTDILNDLIVFEPVSTGLAKSNAYEIWAGHATVHADVDESEYADPSKIKFSYSSDLSNWTTIDAVRNSEGVYSASLTGLTGSTAYTYKLVIDGSDVGEAMSFTTGAAPQLPNSGFETTSNAESNNWVSFFDPAASDDALKTKFWDNGSSASAGMLGSSYAICYSDSDVPSGTGSTKSARLQSKSAAGKLAAGNLFTGTFAGTVGMDGKVNFGRSWTARPTAVRVWVKYLGGKVDKTASGCPLTSNDYDIASIQVAIGTWGYKKYGGTSESPVQVYTADKNTFWDYTQLPETIAYGKWEETGTGTVSEWQQITIPLTYYSETDFPTHIVVSCAASKYGDYFAGSYSSTMWVDDFELIYE